MVNDDLVERIVQEVMKRMTPADEPKKSNLDGKRILALFCGGSIGLRESLAEIRKIIEAGHNVQAVFTPAAERVIGMDLLKSYLGSIPIITEANWQPPGVLIKDADIVIIPVLTLNSAAKLANGIADNLVLNVVLYSLLFGKPVIAVGDACNPYNEMRVKLGMNAENDSLYQVFLDNNKRLVENGIILVDSGDLSASVLEKKYEKVCSEKVQEQPEPVFTKRVLSAGDVALCKDSVMRVSKKTVVTDMAKELASERGIKLISV